MREWHHLWSHKSLKCSQPAMLRVSKEFLNHQVGKKYFSKHGFNKIKLNSGQYAFLMESNSIQYQVKDEQGVSNQ